MSDFGYSRVTAFELELSEWSPLSLDVKAEPSPFLTSRLGLNHTFFSIHIERGYACTRKMGFAVLVLTTKHGSHSSCTAQLRQLMLNPYVVTCTRSFSRDTVRMPSLSENYDLCGLSLAIYNPYFSLFSGIRWSDKWVIF